MTDPRFGGGRSSASAEAASWRVTPKGATVSTNLDVLDLARHGDPGRVWVVAETQAGGRARRGRAWTSEPGNLYASALLIDPGLPDHLPELPFVSAVATADAVEAATEGRCRPGLKWPNDLMIGGRKFVGILLEAARTPDGRTAVAVGIGVNCRHHPFGTETPATNLLLEGFDVRPEALFAALRETFAARIAEWAEGAGFPAIRSAWLARAVGLGGAIRVRLVEGEDEGVFEGIDDAGHLMLARADGSRRKISAGDVFFPAQKDGS
ncbi:MAG: biotin--[acetyl-CoA-carboxylase] ligase [Hyphomicrobiales bacterium]|nr:biotin--[acetyl-CoA-carboxylase] ligase [Hyphomicrobiales bacterium]